MAASCSEFTPTGYSEKEDLATVSSLDYSVAGNGSHAVQIKWTLPADKDVTGCILYRNAQEIERFDLTPTREYTYTALGTPLGQEVLYTVKVTYADGSISTGKSITYTLPEETFEGVTNLKSDVDGRSVTLSWTLPTQVGVTGVRIMTNGVESSAFIVEGQVTSYTLKAQPMEATHTYTVEAVYDTYYFSPGVDVKATIPYVEPNILFLLPSDAATYNDLKDDDELAAAQWFAQQPNTYFCHPSEIADYDPALYSVMWIMVDRVDLPLGWENLPGDIAAPETIEALKSYSANGGSLFLSNMATQLTVPLEFVPKNMPPTVYGNGAGGSGDDVWSINLYLGWDYKAGADQGFYDRTEHAIFKDLTLEVVNGYPYPSLPLIGPGVREDHNCLWDCNIYGKGTQSDVVKNFEVTTNSLVLATWGQVRDHCIAGMVDFYGNAVHGRCVAMGLAAYEWNQNSGVNPYQGNIIKLTENILNYLK